jgi:hypothetical protein
MSPNPFADEPLPENVVRLTSVADPLDPYAAPPGLNEYKTDRDPGVGVWRDGKSVVMHYQAALPPRCIVTNDPTETFGKQSITWAHLNDLRGKTVRLNYGLSSAIYHRRRRTVIAAFVASVVALGPALLLLEDEFWMTAMVLLALVSFVIALRIAWKAACPLTYVSSQQNYVWLAGASPAFLDSLPNWPGFHG